LSGEIRLGRTKLGHGNTEIFGDLGVTPADLASPQERGIV
jgi:hypothetical protein